MKTLLTAISICIASTLLSQSGCAIKADSIYIIIDTENDYIRSLVSPSHKNSHRYRFDSLYSKTKFKRDAVRFSYNRNIHKVTDTTRSYLRGKFVIDYNWMYANFERKEIRACFYDHNIKKYFLVKPLTKDSIKIIPSYCKSTIHNDLGGMINYISDSLGNIINITCGWASKGSSKGCLKIFPRFGEKRMIYVNDKEVVAKLITYKPKEIWRIEETGEEIEYTYPLEPNYDYWEDYKY